MGATQRNLSKQLVVRVDGELLDHLKRDADANGRTVAQSVRFLLNKQVHTAV
jgi:predicted HicB family RNase H-like nuclease